MFLHQSVILSTQGGVWQIPIPRQTPPGRYSPLGRNLPAQTGLWADTPQIDSFLQRRPLQWTVRILLECILVNHVFTKHSLSGWLDCIGVYVLTVVYFITISWLFEQLPKFRKWKLYLSELADVDLIFHFHRPNNRLRPLPLGSLGNLGFTTVQDLATVIDTILFKNRNQSLLGK